MARIYTLIFQIKLFNLIGISLLFLFVGCKSAEKQKTDVTDPAIGFYCADSEFSPTVDYFRQHEIGKSVDQTTAMKKAIRLAQNELGESIYSTLFDAIEKYLVHQQMSYNKSMEKEIADFSTQLSEEMVENVNIICEETVQSKNGMYFTYIVIEISTAEVLQKVQRLGSQSSLLNFDIDAEKFRNTFRLVKVQHENPE
jgi:hypothetical protein